MLSIETSEAVIRDLVCASTFNPASVTVVVRLPLFPTTTRIQTPSTPTVSSGPRPIEKEADGLEDREQRRESRPQIARNVVTLGAQRRSKLGGPARAPLLTITHRGRSATRQWARARMCVHSGRRA